MEAVKYHILLIDYAKGELTDTTVSDAPSRTDAVLGALEQVPNTAYSDPILIVPQYLH